MTLLMTVMLVSMVTGCLLVSALAALSSAEAKREMRQMAVARRPVSRRHARRAHAQRQQRRYNG